MQVNDLKNAFNRFIGSVTSISILTNSCGVARQHSGQNAIELLREVMSEVLKESVEATGLVAPEASYNTACVDASLHPDFCDCVPVATPAIGYAERFRQAMDHSLGRERAARTFGALTEMHLVGCDCGDCPGRTLEDAWAIIAELQAAAKARTVTVDVTLDTKNVVAIIEAELARLTAEQTSGTLIDLDHDLKVERASLGQPHIDSTNAARSELVHFFQDELKRKDFNNYINEKLSGDFAWSVMGGINKLKRILRERNDEIGKLQSRVRSLEESAAALERAKTNVRLANLNGTRKSPDEILYDQFQEGRPTGVEVRCASVTITPVEPEVELAVKSAEEHKWPLGSLCGNVKINDHSGEE